MNSAPPTSELDIRTVLIIDDTPTNLAVMIDDLEDHGFRVVIARNGPEGLKRAQFVHPDLILLDVMMPDMDGFETCRQLKASEATRDIPVIFMTALEETRDKITGFEVGGVDYVTKPFQMAEALARINTHLSLHTMRKQLAVQNAQLQREIAVREQVESALQHAYDDLEERVAQRTAELADANARLKGEIAERMRAEEISREQLHFTQQLLQSIPTPVFYKDEAGRYLGCNRAYEEYSGIKREGLMGKTVYELAPKDLADIYAATDNELFQNPGTQVQETSVIYADGTRHDVILSKATFSKADGRLGGLVGVMLDISERKHAEEALREKEARIRRLVESNIIGVFFWDIHGHTFDANDAFLRIVGYTPDDLRSGKIRWNEMTPAEYAGAEELAMNELKMIRSCAPYEKEFIRKDGGHIPVLMGAALLDGSQEQGVAFVVDLTERKQAEERVRHMAHHDALTGLPNRLLFQDRVNQAISQAQRSQHRVGMLFIDLDHFKDINDSLGHQIGDRLLRAAARRLQRCLRTGDSVARLGGDEFVISVPALEDDNAAILIAGKSLEALRRPFFIDQHELHVTNSIGISVYPTDGRDAETLMRAADTAMYYAKARGRDNYQFFTSRLNEAAQRRLTIANRLHQALQRGEFMLYYQPNIDLGTGQITSAEALIRWNQPQMGAISPGEFVRIAEETGLIVPLGEWVLRAACKQLRRWHDNGHDNIGIAVNLSPHQFRRPGFPDLAARILQESGVPPAAVEMEITEGVFVMQSQENKNVLEQLADLGVRLAVDDFGTGYSSLAYLQHFPIHALKIDQSFVSGIDIDANDTTIVTAIIAMAHSLHLKVIAEGVETIDQVNFLKNHGCDSVQGFYFSRAIPADEFAELLEKQKQGVLEYQGVL